MTDHLIFLIDADVSFEQYNGWSVGMTTGQAKSEKYGCYSQNDLDYLNSMVNGWLQGKDGRAKEFLVYDK